MSNLYDRHRTWLKFSKEALQQIADDDSMLDAAAFNAQQSLEFLMKHIIDECGGKYQKTHNIRVVTGIMNELFTFSRVREILSMADTITSWEAESRCGQGVIAIVNDIKLCHELIEQLDMEWIAYRNKEDNSEQPSQSSKISELLNQAEVNKE